MCKFYWSYIIVLVSFFFMKLVCWMIGNFVIGWYSLMKRFVILCVLWLMCKCVIVVKVFSY